MAILKAVQFPDSLLQKSSEEVKDFDSKLETFVQDMVDTMNSNKFCVGLAAVQVGVLKQIFVIFHIIIQILKLSQSLPSYYT